MKQDFDPNIKRMIICGIVFYLAIAPIIATILLSYAYEYLSFNDATIFLSFGIIWASAVFWIFARKIFNIDIKFLVIEGFAGALILHIIKQMCWIVIFSFVYLIGII